uniref:ATP synthase epsilon chain n=1 Tax=uncultured bacterium contig00031 TaxID=1181520 RepID=A0A806KQA5_9BACT|nr:ATP synthase epsilon chain [uncultured bacterium contig00031]
MATLFDFEIHTPYRLFFSGKAQAIVLTIADGEIGIYANHSALTAPVVASILNIKDADNKWSYAFISDGILEVKKEKNVLIVASAEWPKEIDRERALKSKQQAEEDLRSANLKFETGMAKAKLRRAECRLKLLDMAGLKK